MNISFAIKTAKDNLAAQKEAGEGDFWGILVVPIPSSSLPVASKWPGLEETVCQGDTGFKPVSTVDTWLPTHQVSEPGDVFLNLTFPPVKMIPVSISQCMG